MRGENFANLRYTEASRHREGRDGRGFHRRAHFRARCRRLTVREHPPCRARCLANYRPQPRLVRPRGRRSQEPRTKCFSVSCRSPPRERLYVYLNIPITSCNIIETKYKCNPNLKKIYIYICANMLSTSSRERRRRIVPRRDLQTLTAQDVSSRTAKSGAATAEKQPIVDANFAQ